MYQPIDDILLIEGGEPTEEEFIAAFQRLIDSGVVWQLQGFYGRTAAYLIDCGHCHPKGGSK